MASATVVDTFSRFSPIIDPRFSYRAEDVVATLEGACAFTGYPKTIRVDQGSEFVSRDLDLWAYAKGVTLDFSRPGKPTDNAFIEAFNGRFRAECLNTHWFMTLADAREKLEDWRSYCNEDRPHGAIGNKPPASLMSPPARPARQRGKSRKTLPSGGPTMGSRSKKAEALIAAGSKLSGRSSGDQLLSTLYSYIHIYVSRCVTTGTPFPMDSLQRRGSLREAKCTHIGAAASNVL